jgi:type II secretory pathway pseudopilin PulG
MHKLFSKFWFFGLQGMDKLVAILILASLLLLSYFNLQISFRRSRDAQRKADIRSIYDALMAYQNDFGKFPASFEGKIVACKGEFNSELDFYELAPCEWYWDGLEDVNDESYPAYLEQIPSDPHHGKGARYLYISNGRHFQVFASLESSREDEYVAAIADRQLNCGSRICNFGRSDGQVPLDKSLEVYENEIRDVEK